MKRQHTAQPNRQAQSSEQRALRSQSETASAQTHPLLALQRQVGNAQVARMLARREAADMLVRQRVIGHQATRQSVLQRHGDEESGGEDPLECPCQDVAPIEKLKKYGKYSNNRYFKPEYIILHRTQGTTVLDPILAHFEVGLDGKIYEANTPQKQVGHLWGKGHSSKLDDNVVSGNSFGIEFVGKEYHIKNIPKSNKESEMKNLRKELFDSGSISLSPKLKLRLMNMSNSELYNTLDATKWQIYPDITTAQKRSAYCLNRHLQSQHNNALKLKTHEEVERKVIGEGENIKEFLTTIEEYNRILDQLQKLAPSFWNQRDVGKMLMQDRAKQEMSKDAFFENFYQINEYAKETLDFMNDLNKMKISNKTRNAIKKLLNNQIKPEGMLEVFYRLRLWFSLTKLTMYSISK